jgi:translation initiation factor IF-3
VRLIGVDGSQLGIVPTREAIEQAREAGYDLAEIAPNATPPVAKILDWGKYRYEQTKQLQRSKKNQKLIEIKTIRLGLKIGQHDIDVKLKQSRKFLTAGNKIKVSLFFRGREITHPELGRAILDRFYAQLEDIGNLEQIATLSGRDLNIVIGPKKDAEVKDS